MKKEDFYAYLKESKELNENSLLQLKQLTKKYPYFQSAKLLLLKNLKEQEDATFISELKKIAIECADRKKLFYYLNDEQFARFFEKEKSEDYSNQDRTELLLHSFLESIDEKENEEDTITETYDLEENSILSSDYLAYLEHVESQSDSPGEPDESKPMKHQELVDRFLEKSASDETLFSTNKDPENNKEKSTQEVDNLLDDDIFLTETLAQVYIKQKKYEQALTIIKRLSLNFPEKSIYFADQIRFLEYLIINDKNKKQK